MTSTSTSETTDPGAAASSRSAAARAVEPAAPARRAHPSLPRVVRPGAPRRAVALRVPWTRAAKAARLRAQAAKPVRKRSRAARRTEAWRTAAPRRGARRAAAPRRPAQVARAARTATRSPAPPSFFAPANDAWIGLSLAELTDPNSATCKATPSSCPFLWLTGEPLSYTNWGNHGPNDREPNYTGACVRLQGTTLDWADQDCNERVRAICETQ
jgi:hypothetical protein